MKIYRIFYYFIFTRKKQVDAFRRNGELHITVLRRSGINLHFI